MFTINQVIEYTDNDIRRLQLGLEIIGALKIPTNESSKILPNGAHPLVEQYGKST